MLIRDSRFDEYTPLLPVEIINSNHPDKLSSPRLHAIIDTGASECCVPGELASIIGLDLKQGTPNVINTAGGEVTAYGHLTDIKIYHPATEELIYTIENVIIDYTPGLNVVLLGHRSFLSHFKLIIDYPDQTYSIIKEPEEEQTA
jgi:hypothetical protein